MDSPLPFLFHKILLVGTVVANSRIYRLVVGFYMH